MGRDLSDRTTLLDIAASAGLDRDLASRRLESGAGIAEVRRCEAEAQRLGVRDVPHFLLNGTYALSCALLGLPRRSPTPCFMLPILPLPSEHYLLRIEHGFARTQCGCDFCKVYCRHLPGRLDPSDLAALCPDGDDGVVFAWAEEHLQAVNDQAYPKLVPARQVNGHCHWYDDGLCAVHRNAPFGCAFFDAHMPPADVDARNRATSQASLLDAAHNGLYSRIYHHLCHRGLTRPSGQRAPLDDEMRLLRLSMEQG